MAALSQPREASAQTHIIYGLEDSRDVSAGTFSPLDPFHASLGVGGGLVWLRSEPARRARLGTSGGVVLTRIDAEVFDLLTLGFAFDALSTEDSGKFEEEVIDTHGNVSTKESGLGLHVLSLSGGLRTPDFCLAVAQFPGGTGWFALHAFARAGHGWVSGGRGIENCWDCTDEDISLSGGAFVEPGVSVTLKIEDSFGFTIDNGYRRYAAAASIEGQWRAALLLSYF